MKLFGTDGIRGIAGQYPLDDETVENIGFSAAKVLKNNKIKPLVIIGRDTRQSGQTISENLKVGLSVAGVEVWDLGIIPTPGVAFLAKQFPVIAGIVISASHNPYKDNGIKFLSHKGTKLSDSMEDLIEKEILKKSSSAKLSKKNNILKIGEVKDKNNLSGEYIDFLINTLPKNINLKGMRLVIDCANGAACEISQKVFCLLGAEVLFINQNPDGKNINLNCGSLHPGNLSNEIRKHNAVCGIAFDGDCDRVIFVDENGEIRDGDYLLAVISEFLKKKKKLKNNVVITTVMANLGFFKTMERLDIEVVKTPVGDRYVYEGMVKRGAVIGGEQSGHIIFSEFLPTGDGILSALQVLSIMQETNQTLSVLCGSMKKYPQVLLNTKVGRKIPVESLTLTSKIIKDIEKELNSDGRVLVRYSGTENLLRVMIEGKEKELIDNMAKEISQTAFNEIEAMK